MSDFVGRLLRHGDLPPVRPRLPALFEPRGTEATGALAGARGPIGVTAEYGTGEDLGAGPPARPPAGEVAPRPRGRFVPVTLPAADPPVEAERSLPAEDSDAVTPDSPSPAPADGRRRAPARSLALPAATTGSHPVTPDSGAWPGPREAVTDPGPERATPPSPPAGDAAAAPARPAGPLALVRPVERTAPARTLDPPPGTGAGSPVPAHPVGPVPAVRPADAPVAPDSPAGPRVTGRTAAPRVRPALVPVPPAGPSPRRRPGGPGGRGGAEPPAVHIAIGRVEVRADREPAAPPPRAPKRQPVLSLDTYLGRRAGGDRP